VVNPGSDLTATLSNKARAFEAAADTMVAVEVVAIARGDKSAWVSDSKERGRDTAEMGRTMSREHRTIGYVMDKKSASRCSFGRDERKEVRIDRCR
jgi:type IV secretory pathway TrbF-like protein